MSDFDAIQVRHELSCGERNHGEGPCELREGGCRVCEADNAAIDDRAALLLIISGETHADGDGTSRLLKCLYGEDSAATIRKALGGSNAKMLHDAVDKIAEQESWIAHLESRIAAKDEVFAEIRREVGGNCFDPTPLEEPDLDGPWLTCGLMSKIDDVMERDFRK